MTIDINCDMGESYGNFKIGNDAAIFPYITSCNIACGFHGGDPLTIEATISNALKHNVRIGAHPAYPDLQGFGRRPMQLSKKELQAIIRYQVAALKGMTESLGGRLAYVKPHGALYNTAASSESESHAIIEAIQTIDGQIAIMGLAGSVLERIAFEKEIPFIAEAFADRQYTDAGQLMSRQEKGAIILNPKKSVEQVLSILQQRQVLSHTGKLIPIRAQSICIHGDNPNAVAILQYLDKEFQLKGIGRMGNKSERI